MLPEVWFNCCGTALHKRHAEAARAIARDVSRNHGTKAFELPAKTRELLKLRHGGWLLFRLPQSTAGKRLMPLNWFVNIAHNAGRICFTNPPGAEQCPNLPAVEVATKHSSTKDRTNFLKGLHIGQWVSARYDTGDFGYHGKFYNAAIVSMSQEQDPKKGNAWPSHVDLAWVFHERENHVQVRRLRPPFVWARGDHADVLDRGRWWECKVMAVVAPDDSDAVSKTQFTVSLGDRTLSVNFAKLRQRYASLATSSGQASTLGTPSLVGSIAPTFLTAGSGPDPFGGGASASKGGKPVKGIKRARSATDVGSGAGGKAVPPSRRTVLVEGTPVRFKDEKSSVWHRGKVKKDHGSVVHVETHQRKTAGGKEVVTVSVKRGDLEALPGRGGYDRTATQERIIAVEDSE